MGAVNVEQRMKEIKSKGYWRVNIRPTKFEKLRIDPVSRCWELAESCSVYLRGWDYPAINVREKFFEEDSVRSGADFRGTVELWRLYQSGQFIHHFSCSEDRYVTEGVAERIHRDASSGLSILSMLYRVTEIFEFAMRLAQKEILQPRLKMSIKLVGMKNRQIFFWDYGRSSPHICKIDEISIEREFSPAEIIAEGHNKALDAAIHIFERFGWEHPPRSILAEDQRKFLERRL